MEGLLIRRNFAFQNGVWLVNTNSLKQLKTANSNSPWAYIWKGLLSEGFLCLRFRGLILGGGFFWWGGGLLSECYGVWLIGTLPKLIFDLFSEFLPENLKCSCHQRKVLPSSFHLNSHTFGLDPQAQKLEYYCLVQHI